MVEPEDSPQKRPTDAPKDDEPWYPAPSNDDPYHGSPQSHDPPHTPPPNRPAMGPPTYMPSAYPYAQPGPPPQTNLKATLSLVFGLIGIMVFPVFGSIVAVILGHLARKEIQTDPSQQGDGLAIAGLIMGWIMIGLVGLVLGFVVLALIVALIVFLVLTIVSMASGEDEDDRPHFPWPGVQHTGPAPQP